MAALPAEAAGIGAPAIGRPGETGIDYVRDRGGRSGQFRGSHGGQFRGGHFRQHYGYRPRIYSYGYTAPYYFYSDEYGGGCSWLRRKAIETGSRYWWRRYRDCLDD